jgi:hypothetical protein
MIRCIFNFFTSAGNPLQKKQAWTEDAAWQKSLGFWENVRRVDARAAQWDRR